MLMHMVNPQAINVAADPTTTPIAQVYAVSLSMKKKMNRNKRTIGTIATNATVAQSLRFSNINEESIGHY